MKDFYKDSVTKTKGLRSNETEIFYIDAHFLDAFTEMTYSTLAHEFQHMLNYVNKMLLAILATLFPLFANAEKVQIGGIWYNLIAILIANLLMIVTIIAENGIAKHEQIIVKAKITLNNFFMVLSPFFLGFQSKIRLYNNKRYTRRCVIWQLLSIN